MSLPRKNEIMPRLLNGGRIDWPLFLTVVAASGGLAAFLPGKASVAILATSSAIMAFSILSALGHGLSVLLLNPLIFFLVAWSVSAGLLSERPVTAILSTVVLILTIVFASMRQDATERTLRTLAFATTFSLLPSMTGLVAPIGPLLRRAGSAGGYAGYFPWNSWTGLCAAAAVLTIALASMTSGIAWWHLPSAGGALVILVLAKSATAIMALAASLGVLGIQTALRRTSPRAKPLIVVAIGTAFLFLAPTAIDFVSKKSLADATGRNESLSGRTIIWQWATEGIKESPYWGYGTEFWRSVGEWNNSGHNGFLDVALFAGIPAALCVCLIIVVAAVRLTASWSLLLPLLAFGVSVNLVISQLISPTIPSLMLWLAVGATLRLQGAGTPRSQTRANEYSHKIPEHNHGLIPPRSFRPTLG